MIFVVVGTKFTKFVCVCVSLVFSLIKTHFSFLFLSIHLLSTTLTK